MMKKSAVKHKVQSFCHQLRRKIRLLIKKTRPPYLQNFSERGRSLPAALIALAVGSLLLAPFLSFVSSRSLGTRAAAETFRAQYAADAGVEFAIWSLLEDPSARPTSLPEIINGHNPMIEITEVSSGFNWLNYSSEYSPNDVGPGGGLAYNYDAGNLIYSLVKEGGGNSPTALYQYLTNSYENQNGNWTKLEEIPRNYNPAGPGVYQLSVDTGSDLIYAGSWDNNAYLFALIKARPTGPLEETDFLYRYTISNNNWNMTTMTPGELGAGACLVYDGSSSLYVFQGESSSFWRYSSSGWQTLTDVPGQVGAGAALVHTGGNEIYAFLGGGSSEFWRYEISSNSWTRLSAQSGGGLPGAVTSGGSLVYNGTDSLYALPGGSNELWRYTISSNTWDELSTAPNGVGSGGDLVMVDSNTGYVLRGGNNDEFWKFIAASPQYDITSQAGSVEIHARIELDGGNITILFWDIE